MICKEGKCQKVFKCRASFIKHIASHNKRVSCLHDDCSRTYSCQKALRKHLRTFHSLQKCGLCTFICQNGDILKQHEKSHKIARKYKKFICPICGANGSLVNRSHHMKTHKPKQNLPKVNVKCSICSKSISKASYSKHLRKCKIQSEQIK